MVKQAKYHPAHLSSHFFGSIGYTTLALAWLLTLGMIGFVVAVWAGFWTNVVDFVATDQSTIASTTSVTPADLRIVSWLLFVGILVVLSYYVGKHLSTFVRGLMRRCHLKVTIRALFGTKCVLALLSAGVVLTATLWLPSDFRVLRMTIVGLTGGFGLLAVVFFTIQQAIVRVHKIAIKHVL